MDTEPSKAWFEFRIEQTFAPGVEAATLGKLLTDMSSAFYAIARARLGKEAARPGPRTADEDSIAAIRILRLVPGSAVLEAEPPPTGLQASLDLGLDLTAEDILLDFTYEAQRLIRNEPSKFSRPEVRRHVTSVMRDAAEIGLTSEVVVRPRDPRRAHDNAEVRVRLPIGWTASSSDTLPTPARRRKLSGHAYMVDVEPGRYRFRLKLPDGRDLTIDAQESLANVLRSAVDRVVEIEALEELAGDQVSSRIAVDMQVLSRSGPGSPIPPRTLAELAEEQGLTGEVPDYRELAAAVWSSEAEVKEFEDYLRKVRQAAS